MSLLDEIKQLKLDEGTKHTIVDTSTKKELSIEVRDTSAIRKNKGCALIMLAILCAIVAVMIVSIACGALLEGKAKEQALCVFSGTLVSGIILSLIIILSINEDNLDSKVELALTTYRKLQKLLEQADFKDELFIEIRNTNIDNTSGEIKITYFDKNNENKELKSITFKYENVHYEKDLNSPKLVINTAENSGVQLYLPIADCENYTKLKGRTNYTD